MVFYNGRICILCSVRSVAIQYECDTRSVFYTLWCDGTKCGYCLEQKWQVQPYPANSSCTYSIQHPAHWRLQRALGKTGRWQINASVSNTSHERFLGHYWLVSCPDGSTSLLRLLGSDWTWCMRTHDGEYNYLYLLYLLGFFLSFLCISIDHRSSTRPGVQFQYFYPMDFNAFFSFRSLGPVSCLLAMVALIRHGPAIVARKFPNSKLLKLSGLFCQLCPLAIFYAVVYLIGVSMEELSSSGWTYPAQASRSFESLWTTYNLGDANVRVLISNIPSMLMLVMMSVLCTMTGVLGITGKFRAGPDGDPSPLEVIDFDAELTTVGFGSIFTALSNGVVTFHRLGSSIQLRMDGGTHRLAVLTSSCFVGTFFFTSLPLGHYIPKFFLGGLFMGSGVSFLESAFLSFRSLPPQKFMGYRLPSPQYWVTVLCILVAAFSSPFQGIGAGLILSLVIFLWDGAQSSPIASMSTGSHTVSRTFRPFWELEALCLHGHRILLFYLQGQLFFGSGQNLASSLVEAIEDGLTPGVPDPQRTRTCLQVCFNFPKI